MEVTIRIDTASKQGSVIDVIDGVTGRSGTNSMRTFKTLPEEIRNSCCRRQINGKGKKLWLASVQTLIQIVWCLPGPVAHDFRMKCARDICRIMGADPSLIAELEAKKQNRIASEMRLVPPRTISKKRIMDLQIATPKKQKLLPISNDVLSEEKVKLSLRAESINLDDVQNRVFRDKMEMVKEVILSEWLQKDDAVCQAVKQALIATLVKTHRTPAPKKLGEFFYLLSVYKLRQLATEKLADEKWADGHAEERDFLTSLIDGPLALPSEELQNQDVLCCSIEGTATASQLFVVYKAWHEQRFGELPKIGSQAFTKELDTFLPPEETSSGSRYRLDDLSPALTRMSQKDQERFIKLVSCYFFQILVRRQRIFSHSHCHKDKKMEISLRPRVENASHLFDVPHSATERREGCQILGAQT